MKRFWALLLVLVCLSGTAMAEVTFTATGAATVSFDADRAVITLQLSAFGDTLADAEKLAAASASTLKSALMGQGVQAADIAIRRTDVQNVTEYHYSKLQQPSLEIIGANVSYEMVAVLGDVSKLDALLDAVIGTKAYDSYAVRLDGSQDAAYAQALGLAAANGMDKAGALADACGVKSVSLLEVKEVGQTVDGLTVTAEVEVTVAAP